MEKTAIPFFIEEVAQRAPTFADLAKIAIDEIRGFDGKAEIVCGPITTGGTGNVVTNLLLFNYAIQLLQRAGRPMFSQMPYEAGIAELAHTWRQKNPKASYCTPILTEFYARIFLPKFVRRAWFLPDWQTSHGAKWERKHLSTHQIEKLTLPHDWMYGLDLPAHINDP